MKPYIPESLPLKNINYERLFTVVGEANENLARYDGLLRGIVNPSVMLSPLLNEEALSSSKIEGTQANLDDVLRHDAGVPSEIADQDDLKEVVNYRTALRLGFDYLQERPITLTLVRQLHKVLLESVRGQNKSPGEFRLDQNWLGPMGCPITEATFVPPSPFHLVESLEIWENYLSQTDKDSILQTAIVHAQFELIHPFKDGNGRIGRILIPLYLYKKQKLYEPMFYISTYLERNREQYYYRLSQISQANDWNGWIEFFLIAVSEQAKQNCGKVHAILNLYNEMKQLIQDATHSQSTVMILDALFTTPLFKTTQFIKALGFNRPTGSATLKKLIDAGILEVVVPNAGSRPALLVFSRLVNIILT